MSCDRFTQETENELLSRLALFWHSSMNIIHKARRRPNFSDGSSPKKSLERPCGYLGNSLAAGSVQQSHESLHEELIGARHEALHLIIDKDVLWSGLEIVTYQILNPYC